MGVDSADGGGEMESERGRIRLEMNIGGRGGMYNTVTRWGYNIIVWNLPVNYNS